MIFIALIACVLVGTGIFFSLSQFPTAAASTGFGLDSSCYGFKSVTSTNTITTGSITATSNELIIIVITGSTTIPNNPTASITDSLSPHLSYAARGNDGTSTVVTACNILEYYALTSSSFSGSFTITVTMSSSANYNVQVFGIVGENTVTPFDTGISVGANQWNGHNTNVAPVSPSYSTNNARDIILGLEGVTDASAETVGTGFTAASYMLNDVNSLGNNAEYKMVTSTQSAKRSLLGPLLQPTGL